MPAGGRGGNNSGSDNDDDNRNYRGGKFTAKLSCRDDYDHWTTSLMNYRENPLIPWQTSVMRRERNKWDLTG